MKEGVDYKIEHGFIQVRIPIEHLEPYAIPLSHKEYQDLRKFRDKIKIAPNYIWVYAK